MTFHGKKKLTVAVLVALSVWPALHIALVEAYDLNAWKLAGWGMYSQPFRHASSIEVVAVGTGGATTPLAHERLPRRVRLELERFLTDRIYFGALAAPTKERFRALLPQLHATYPRYSGFRLELRERRLNPTTGFFDDTAVTVELTR